jgi:FMN phosphatase YigB (HAD superfamily)
MADRSITIVFDGDQALWDQRSAMDRALNEARLEIMRSTGRALDEIPDGGSIIVIGRALADGEPTATVSSIRHRTFATVLGDLGASSNAAAVERIVDVYVRRRYELSRPYPDTVPMLAKLRERYGVVLLTNEITQPQRIGL